LEMHVILYSQQRKGHNLVFLTQTQYISDYGSYVFISARTWKHVVPRLLHRCRSVFKIIPFVALRSY